MIALIHLTEISEENPTNVMCGTGITNKVLDVLNSTIHHITNVHVHAVLERDTRQLANAS